METQLASVADLNSVLRDTAFLADYDFEVESCALRECRVRVPFNTRFERPGGIVSGMTIMGAADVAMWLAIMTARGTKEVRVTSVMETAFLRSGKNEAIVYAAKILKLGKRMAYGTVEAIGSNSGLLAHHVITYARVSD